MTNKLQLSAVDDAGSAMSRRSRFQSGVRRRELLITTAMTLVFSATSARALVVKGSLPWTPNAGTPPTAVRPGPWVYFTPEEGAAIEALVDRLIPPDPQTPGGKDAGCAVFIDRQLAGPYGSAEGLYMHGPFADGTPQQGDQSPLTPAVRYRQALAALDKYCRATFAGKPFVQLSDDQKDKVITGLEKGQVQLEGTSGRTFFEHAAAEHAGGVLRRPGLWRQSRHGRLEDDRISRRALRLSRLGRAPQRALSAATRRHCRPTRIGANGATSHVRSIGNHDAQIAGN